MNTDAVGTVWPQFSPKLLVDFVNGTQVAGELLRVRANRTGLFKRASAALTGRSARENNLIQAALVEGQMSTIAWLTALQDAQADSDLALVRVAQALAAVRTRLDTRDSEIEDRFHTLEGKHNALRKELDVLRLEFDARAELEWALGEARQLTDLSPLAKAFYVFDRLWWGPFGSLIRKPPQGQEERVERHAREAVQRVTELLALEHGTNRSLLIDLEEVSLAARRMQGPEAEMVRYLSAGADAELAPFHVVLADGADGNRPLALPQRASVERISKRLWSEVKWAGEGRIHDDT